MILNWSLRLQMNRPDEERQLAPEWFKAKQIVSPDRLADKNRSIGEPPSAEAKNQGGEFFMDSAGGRNFELWTSRGIGKMT